jgi:AraC-like DNA-binding protein
MKNKMGNDNAIVEGSFFTILPVQPMLQDWVESIFIMNWQSERYSFGPVYTYPWSATTHIFLTIRNEPSFVTTHNEHHFIYYPDNFITGPKLLNETVDLGLRRHIVGVTFKPGGVERLLGLPVSELVNTPLDASLVLGSEIDHLSDRLKNAKDNPEIFTLVEHFLLEKSATVKPVSSFDRAINELVKHRGNLSIKTVADYVGVSMRHLERKSLLSLGISPKLFAKITRFTSACIFKEAHPDVPWSSLAYEFGYADQTHMIHDFKAFSGLTPSAIDLRIKASDVKLITTIEGKI